MTETMLNIANAFRSAGTSPYQRETSSPGLTRTIVVSRSSRLGGTETLPVLKRTPVPEELESDQNESLEQKIASLFVHAH